MNNYRFMYILLLVIIMILFACINYKSLFVTHENFFGKVNTAPAVDQSNAVTDNKEITHNISGITSDSKLDNITTQINGCQGLIDELNSMIPRNIEDIRIGTVSQTEDLDAVNVDINTSSELKYNPITETSTPASIWTINWILPRGQQGPTGIQGPKGPQGENGDPGSSGDRGLQGPWGKDCGNC